MKDSQCKHILVTGGAGFLGSHLCDRLLRDGHDVLCVDNFFTGSKRNIAHLRDEPCFEVLRHDVTFPLYVEVDEIYNLACPASPIHYQTDPVQTTKTSVHGAINMLGLAKRLGARILQASTSEVYGDPKVHPQTEDYWGHVNPIGVRSCYDEGKRCAETLFFDYQRQRGLSTKVARIFNTYGPRMHPNDGRVVSNFIVNALSGEPLTLYGDGQQIRDWIYVEDHCRAVSAVLARGTPGEVYNIGGDCERANLDVVREICQIVDRLRPDLPHAPCSSLIAFVTERSSIERILTHLCAPTVAPCVVPARAPPGFNTDCDQRPVWEAEIEPVPEIDFDQRRGW